MTLVIPNNFMHIIQPFQHVSATSPWSTTYAINAGSFVNAQAALDEADTIFRGRWVSQTDSNVTLGAAVGYFRRTADELNVFTSTVASEAGTAAKASAPSSVTLSVSKRSSRVGKNARGRCFIPIGLSEASVDEVGALTTAARNALQVVANGWLDDLQGASFVLSGMILLHSEGVVDSEGAPLTPDLVTTLFVQPVCRTQSRRLAS